MGTLVQHAEKAASNQKFLDFISNAGYPDWTATVIFYRAVHLVEMMFAADNSHCNSHEERNAKLQKDHKDVYEEYHPLYNFARWARYDCRKFHGSNLPECFQRLEALEKKVEAHIAAKKK